MENISMEFTYHPSDNNIGIVSVSGEVDLSNVGQFSDFLDQVIASPCKVLIFNLKGLSYMNSTGFGALSSRTMDDKEDQRIIFCDLEKNIIDIFILFGLDQICEIFPDMDSALTSAQHGEKPKEEPTSPEPPMQNSVPIPPEPETPPATPPPSAPAPQREAVAEAIEVAPPKAAFPVIRGCPDCGKKVNFRAAGHYKCPSCGVIQYVNEEGNVSVIEQPLSPSLPAVPKPSKEDEINISLPSDAHHLNKIRDFVISFTLKIFTKEERANLAMAVDEACANAIEHAHKFDRNKKIHMKIIITEDLFSMEIKDSGENTFSDSIPNALAGQAKKSRQETTSSNQKTIMETGRGMGLFLINQMMDEAKAEKTETGGTALYMAKTIKKTAQTQAES